MPSAKWLHTLPRALAHGGENVYIRGCLDKTTDNKAMDVSVLQHANDKHPRQVAVEEVVTMIRGEAWPPGYGPLLVAGAVVEGGLQRKHVRWLTGLSAVHITGHGDGSMGSHDGITGRHDGITGSHDGSISGNGQPPWAADTRTPQQRQTLRRLLEELHRRYPRALITGHHDLNPHRDCPCFDAVSEYIDLEPKP